MVQFFREGFMAPSGTSINKLALDLHVAPNRLLEIVKSRGERVFDLQSAGILREARGE